ncbi:unnamed protein product, partial [Closterium sp. NIES-65]
MARMVPLSVLALLALLSTFSHPRTALVAAVSDRRQLATPAADSFQLTGDSGFHDGEYDGLDDTGLLNLSEAEQADFLRQSEAEESDFLQYDSESVPIQPNNAQRAALLSLKTAWGSDFFKAETWSDAEGEHQWWGVTVDSEGDVVALELPNANLEGEIPEELTKFHDLATLDLRGNKLTGSIPEGIFSSLPSLQDIYLSDNLLQGKVPWIEFFYSNESKVSTLRLDGNRFSGKIRPKAFDNATSLQALFLGNNKFYGKIPRSLGSCKEISVIDLKNNEFSDLMPTTIADLPGLEVLDVSENKLTGPIPNFLGRLPSLVNLDLSNNQFSGLVPDSFKLFSHKARAVKIGDNFLTGPLPQFPRFSKGCGINGVGGLDTTSCYMLRSLLDFEGNFFYGNYSLDIQLPGSENLPAMSTVCPYEYPESIYVNDNCLSSTDLCEVEKQRPPKECDEFCGTGSPEGQCGGKGVVSKHLKSIEDGSDSKRDHTDDVNMALIDQVHKLSLQVQQLSTSSRPITVVNAPPAQERGGSIVGYVIPVAVIGAAGYGVMWWKGWRVSDLMYVTRRGMDQAVKLMGAKVTELQTALDTAKKQLAGRLEGVSKSVAEGLKMQAIIKKDVIEVKGVVTSVSRDLDNMHGLVEGMDTKLASLEQKQDIATRGVLLLCSFVSRGLQGNPGNQELLKGLADMSQMAVPQLAAGKGAPAGGAVGLSGLKELEFISSALESSVHHT